MSSRSPKFRPATAAALIGWFIAISAGCAREAGPPPQTDAFLSYLQLAHGLATQLQKLKSATEYQASKAQFDQACTDLEALQVKFQALSSEEAEPLAREHADLVRKTRQACDQLARRHAKSPGILGPDWQRLERALRDAQRT